MTKSMKHQMTVSALGILASALICAKTVCAETAQTGAGRTPAEISIAKAEEQIAKQPGHIPNYSGLAMAYARRARETSDVGFYAKAEETLQRALKIEPDNFDALKVRAWLLL